MTPRKAARDDGAQRTIRAALSGLAKRPKAYWGYSQAFMRACEAELTYTPGDLADNPFFVLEAGSCLPGFYALTRVADGPMELEALFVEPACIGSGCGRLLIEHAKQNAARLYAAAGATPAACGNRKACRDASSRSTASRLRRARTGPYDIS